MMRRLPAFCCLRLWLILFLLIPAFTNLLHAEQFGIYTYTVTAQETVTITDVSEDTVGTITVPDTINGKPVTSIGNSAFSDCTNLTSITLPGSLTSIGDSAFSYCYFLTSITIPVSLTVIGSSAFSNCNRLTSLTIPPSVTSIRNFTFFDCTALTSITLPDSLTAIGDGAFFYCSGLTSLTLPASLTSIGDGAFYRCSRLTRITVPSSITSIGEATFAYCSGLTNLTLSASLTSIGKSAFSSCSRLTSLTLPASLTSIGQSSFSDCYGLTNFIFPDSLTSIGNYAFSGCHGLISLTFLGNAPGIDSNSPYPRPQAYTAYWLSSKTGFTAPIWQGHPAVRIDESVYPAASWLLQNKLPVDSDLQQDPNDDGVSHLMAYALNLDPRLNLSASLPAPVVGPDTLSLTFHAAAAGITYEVETSTGLDQWTTEGVTLSSIGADQRRTASVARSGPGRFLRLKVAD